MAYTIRLTRTKVIERSVDADTLRTLLAQADIEWTPDVAVGDDDIIDALDNGLPNGLTWDWFEASDVYPAEISVEVVEHDGPTDAERAALGMIGENGIRYVP